MIVFFIFLLFFIISPFSFALCAWELSCLVPFARSFLLKFWWFLCWKKNLFYFLLKLKCLFLLLVIKCSSIDVQLLLLFSVYCLMSIVFAIIYWCSSLIVGIVVHRQLLLLLVFNFYCSFLTVVSHHWWVFSLVKIEYEIIF